MNVADIDGAVLAFAVAKALPPMHTSFGELQPGLQFDSSGRAVECARLAGGKVYDIYRPDLSWEQGGPIIDRERFVFTPRPAHRGGGVFASYPGKDGVWGETYLIAAMRAFVMARYGENFLEIPEPPSEAAA